MSTNELSVEITPEKDGAVQQIIDNLLAELDFLVDLAVEDRRRLSKMGRKNVDFVERGYRHAEGTPRFLPPYITLEEFKKDMDLGGWLRKLEKRMDTVVDKVKDTAILAESEAFKSSRLYYNSVKAAARGGDEEAELIARDMAVHYKKLGAGKTGEPVPEEPQQTEEPQP